MQASSFRFKLTLPRLIEVDGSELDRESFFGWLWNRFGEQGLQGVHEGTLLSEEASAQGLETESWTVDAAEAPRERDWVSGQHSAEAELYFSSEELALAARRVLRAQLSLDCGEISEQVPEDWDAQWKAGFQGTDMEPFWTIVPPWKKVLRINPGAGFGTGTHETTRLCLKAIAEIRSGGALDRPLESKVALDFGSGSGILAIAMARLGCDRVDAVEIDPLAVDNARENAALNEVSEQVVLSNHLPAIKEGYDLVVANILRPVLLEFKSDLVSRMKPGATLILSGLIYSDVLSVSQAFSELLGGRLPREESLGEWRCLIWTA